MSWDPELIRRCMETADEMQPEEAASIAFSRIVVNGTCERPIPPIHVTNLAALISIMNGTCFEVPSGASFSRWGDGPTGRSYSRARGAGLVGESDSAKTIPVALRIDPTLVSQHTSDCKYRFANDKFGAGLVPQMGNGTRISRIPRGDLQFFNQGRVEWRAIG